MRNVLTLFSLLILPGFAQPVQGPLLLRFPYLRGEPAAEPPLSPASWQNALTPAVFEPFDSTLPDALLFTEAERVWVEHLRAAFQKVGQGEYAGAKSMFEEFLQVYPDHAPSQVALADILFTMGDLAAAEDVYLRLLEAHPFHFQALNNLAWLYSTAPAKTSRNPAAAHELVRKAMMVAPESHHVWSTYSQALFAQGRFAEAADASGVAIHLAQRTRAPVEVLVNYLLQLDRARAAVQATSLLD
jgi:tetratricopeptide (TPR) repeat protein